jgi:hypothetical protein
MKDKRCSQNRPGRTTTLTCAVCALLLITVAAPAAAQADKCSTGASCRLQGSWLSEVDIGGMFFAQYEGGANATSGPLSLEWILFDTTLFNNFPTAVRLTQAAGGWRSHGRSYDYTWVAYGLDSAGIPVYAIKGSGTGPRGLCRAGFRSPGWRPGDLPLGLWDEGADSGRSVHLPLSAEPLSVWARRAPPALPHIETSSIGICAGASTAQRSRAPALAAGTRTTAMIGREAALD